MIRNLLVLAVVAQMSCKVQLTPENLAKSWHAYQDAKKDLTPENEYYVGRSVATTLLARADYKYTESEQWKQGQLGKTTAYVNAVGNVLAAAAMGAPRKDDRPSPVAGWHFVIVDDATINAFAAPGGFILVNRGTIEAAKNEDELAAVLAHEIGHVVRGHALGSIKKSRMSGVYKEFLSSSVQLDEAQLGTLTKAFEGAMDDMVDSMVVKGYSRESELEADRIGLKIMSDAGYDPNAFVSFLETLEKQQGGGKGGFSATHPKASDRIAQLRGQVTKYPAVTIPKVRIKRFKAAVAFD